MREDTGRGRKGRWHDGQSYRARIARVEEQLANAGCGEFGDHDTAAFRNFKRARIYHQDYWRQFAANAAHEAGGWSVAADGRGYSREGRQFSSAGDSRREIARDSIRNADGQRAGEIRGAAGGFVC